MNKSKLRQLIREQIKLSFNEGMYDIPERKDYVVVDKRNLRPLKMNYGGGEYYEKWSTEEKAKADADELNRAYQKTYGAVEGPHVVMYKSDYYSEKRNLAEVNYPTPEIELRRLGIRYTLSGNKNKPIEKVFKPIDKSDDFYRKFDDVVDRYGLSNSVVIQNKANLASLNYEGTCGYDTDARTGKKFKTPGGL